MFGAVYAAVVAVRQPEVGGLHALLTNEAIVSKLSVMPDFSIWLAWVPMLLIPIAVQWWAVWYPGAEPGGGGYIAQRMLSAKDEKNAIGATLFFNFMHYANRSENHGRQRINVENDLANLDRRKRHGTHNQAVEEDTQIDGAEPAQECGRLAAIA